MSSTHLDIPDTAASIVQQAAHWWAVLDGEGVSSAEHQAFAAWVARSPERVEAFLRVATLMGTLNSKSVRWPDTPTQTLIDNARRTSAVIPFSRGPGAAFGRIFHEGKANTNTSTSRRHPTLWLSGMAATLVLACAAVWLLNTPPRYQTAVGDQRSVLLPDGSMVTLNTSTRIEVDFRDGRRSLRLIEGQALFQVAHDAERPFVVNAGNAFIRAVGTQFDVDRRSKDTTVTVVEGRVQIATRNEAGKAPAAEGGAHDGLSIDLRTALPSALPIALSAGEQITVSDGRAIRTKAVDATTATAWTQRRLIFERRSLADVALEFNRYNRTHIDIDDAGLRAQEITGVFQANDTASFLHFLAGLPGVHIETTPAGDHRVTSKKIFSREGEPK